MQNKKKTLTARVSELQTRSKKSCQNFSISSVKMLYFKLLILKQKRNVEQCQYCSKYYPDPRGLNGISKANNT